MPQQLRRLFSFPLFLGGTLVVEAFVTSIALGAPAGRFLLCGDFCWLIASAQRILTTGTWPTEDIYSFTAQGNSWINYQWLAGLLMDVSARLGGLRGLAALFLALWCILVLLIFCSAWVRSGNVKAAAAATAFAPLMLQGPPLLSLRSQLLGYIFLLATLISLERYRQGRQGNLWMLPGFFLLWVNTHGSFTLGLLALALYIGGGLKKFSWGPVVAQRWTPGQLRHLEVVALLCVLALTATPYGTRLAAYPLEYAWLQSYSIHHISEWVPLKLTSPLGWGSLALLAAFFIGEGRLRAAFRPEEVVLLVLAVFESLLHIRFLFLFAAVFIPLFAVLLARWVPRYDPTLDRPVLNAVLVTLFFCGMFRAFPSKAQLDAALSRAYPPNAVGYLRQHPAARRIYSNEGWGSYVLWSLGPERKVFVDGRFDLYDYSGVMLDYFQIDTPGSRTGLLIQKYGIDTFLIYPESRLAEYLASQAGWKRVYADEISTIFLRKHSDCSPQGRSEME